MSDTKEEQCCEPMEGPPGKDGRDGRDGRNGKDGCRGRRGSRGSTGRRGRTGSPGPRGPEGPSGPEGPEGPSGPEGPEGPKGPEGPQGPEGPKGPEGPSGPQGPSLTNANYLWAVKTNTQPLTTALTAETILFTATPQLNGWTYNAITGEFTCTTSGKYMVSYTVEMEATGGSRVATTMATLNGQEILGSAITQGFQSSSLTQAWTNFFILEAAAPDIFCLKFSGSSTFVRIQSETPIIGETSVSASLTITRIA